MDDPILATALVAAVLAGVLGIYLMLPNGDVSSLFVRRVRVGLATAALLAFLFAMARSTLRSPNGFEGHWAAAFLNLLFTAGSLVGATMTIAARSIVRGVSGFAGMLLANTGLLLIGQAPFLSLMGLAAFSVPALTGLLLPAHSTKRFLAPADPNEAHEPFLSVATAAFLTMAALIAIHGTPAAGPGSGYHLVHAPPPPQAAMRVRGSEFVPAHLSVGAVLFAVGAVGFFSRRSQWAAVLALAITFQGCLLTVAALRVSHETITGPALAWFAIPITAMCGLLASPVTQELKQCYTEYRLRQQQCEPVVVSDDGGGDAAEVSDG